MRTLLATSPAEHVAGVRGRYAVIVPGMDPAVDRADAEAIRRARPTGTTDVIEVPETDRRLARAESLESGREARRRGLYVFSADAADAITRWLDSRWATVAERPYD